MLSRFVNKSSIPLCTIVRSSSAVAPPDPKSLMTANDRNPERDLVNFPRIPRPDVGAKVRLGFIPDDWFQFLHSKTGVTGPYILGTGIWTFLMSKEYLVYDHEYYTGLCLIAMAYYACTKYGKKVTDHLTAEANEVKEILDNQKYGNIKNLQAAIDEAHSEREMCKAQSIIFDAKKENIALQLEAEYRNRMQQVYTTVKKRLDYHIEVESIKNRVEQQHMVNWIIDSVKKSITPTQEAAAMKQCLTDLKALSAKA